MLAELQTPGELQLADRLLMNSDLARQQLREKLWGVQQQQQLLWQCLQGLGGVSAEGRGLALQARIPFAESRPEHTQGKHGQVSM